MPNPPQEGTTRGGLLMITSINKRIEPPQSQKAPYLSLVTQDRDLNRTPCAVTLDPNTEPSRKASKSVVNIEFRDSPNRKPLLCAPRKKISMLTGEQGRKITTQRDPLRVRYHDLFRQSIDNIFKTTVQIGPCAKTIPRDEYQDLFYQRRLIQVERIVHPLRVRDKRGLEMNKTLNIPRKQVGYLSIGRTTQVEGFFGKTKPNKKASGNMNKTKVSPTEVLLPPRRPNNKRDYFVFGMNDRLSSDDRTELYRDFLWKINYSNALYVFTPQQLSTPYRYSVGPGNNSNLIKGIMHRRSWWTLKTEGSCHFSWTQLKVSAVYEDQRLLQKNGEGATPISGQLTLSCTPSKSSLDRSRLSTIGQASKNVPSEASQTEIHESTCLNASADKISHSKLAEPTLTKAESALNSKDSNNKSIEARQIDFNHAKIFSAFDLGHWCEHTARNGRTQSKICDQTYPRRTKLYEKKPFSKIEDSDGLKVHNHFAQNFYIGNKKALFYNVRKYKQLRHQTPWGMLPMTFHLSRGTNDPEYESFAQHFQKWEQQKQKDKSFRNMWIVKPGENTNRGNGITVCYTLDDIRARINGRERNNDGKMRTFILQKYIETPLLYQNRKFDIRHYLLMSCVNGCLKAYWYEQGYIRTSSFQFTTKYCKDPLVHLTNDAVQKKSEGYGKFQKGNKLSYAQFQKYLEGTYPTKKWNFFKDVLPRMREYALESVKATYSLLDPNRLEHNFQLFGLDFMIDDQFNPWLIEVNSNPCLQLSCPILSRLIPNMIENAFRICLDPLFPPPEGWVNNRKYFLTDDTLGENKFQLIFDEAMDGLEIEKLFGNQERMEGMGKIEEDQEIFQDDGNQNWEQQQQ